jgi:hypothetical protein
MNWDSGHHCTETVFIIQQISLAKSDSSASLRDDRSPMRNNILETIGACDEYGCSVRSPMASTSGCYENVCIQQGDGLDYFPGNVWMPLFRMVPVAFAGLDGFVSRPHVS